MSQEVEELILMNICLTSDTEMEISTRKISISLRIRVTELNHVRFQFLTAATMKDIVFLDIRTHFVPHRRHITSPLQIATG
jgi:hypothetical protein